MRKKILIIDGEAQGKLDAALRNAGYSCTRAASVREALPAAESGGFDLAVLDAALPEVHLPDCVSLLRAKGNCPVLVLAPAGGGEKLIELLNAGAEDYLTRPFELRELIERIEIQIKRFMAPEQSGALSYRDLTLDPNTFSVTLQGKKLKLTKQEFRILELMLLSPPGRVFTKQDFFDYAWGCSYIGVDKTINVHICNIRRKFRAITEDAYIETIWGLGFRLV